MRQIFNYEGPITQGIEKILDFLLLSILWLIVSLPIFTIGATSTALYYTARKVLRRDIGYITKDFFRSFKNNFRQATIIWMILLGIIAFLVVDIWFVYRLCINGILHQSVLYLLIILGTLVVTWAQYIFSYLSHFSDTNGRIIKNCFMIGLSNIIPTLGIALLLIMALFFLWDIPGGVLLVPSGLGLLCGIITDRVFKKYMTEDELEKDRESSQFHLYS